jgi:acetate kinase
MNVLALNCGSSSLKYAVLAGDDALARGTIDRIGDDDVDHAAAARSIFDELEARRISVDAIGHRLVHGGPHHVEPTRVSDELLASLRGAVAFAPLHLPAELAVIDVARARYERAPQAVCFDTYFHRTLPEHAQRFALPASLFDAGIRRYGFHGLSYEYVVETLGAATLGRAVIAHLGSGASMAAIRDGRSIDTTMAFTPTAGLVMGTRSGDLDPGLVVYLLEHGYDVRSFDRLVNHEAGLLALSGTSADMKTLLAARATDRRAALAIDVFCVCAKKWIGAFAAVLGGLDSLVFTGGIGEHAADVRREIVEGLEHLGVGSVCKTHVIHTDEERMIARHTRRVLKEETS